MMDGITVLSEEVVKGSSPTLVLTLGTILAIMVGIGFGGAIAELSDNLVAALITGVLSFIIVLGFTIYFKPLEPKASYVKYKVTIDDSVSFKEFDKRYKIVDQEGEIYTIIEKDKTKK